MRFREFLDHLGVVVLVLFIAALVAAVAMLYKAEDRLGPPPMFEQEQWEDRK